MSGPGTFPGYPACGSILRPTLFPLYINDLPDDAICNIAIYADDATLYCKSDQTSNLWQQLELASEPESELRDTVDWWRKKLVNFNTGKWMDSYLKKNHLLRCCNYLSLLNWIGALTLSLLLKLSLRKS